jgi:elongation factor G
VFENEIVGGTIPREYIKPIDEGIKEALTRGILAGYPVDDVKIQLYDGSFPRRRFVGNGVQDCRLDGVPGCGEEGEARSARTGDARRSGRPERLHGRRDGRSGQPARTDSVAGRSRRHADHQCARPLSEMFGYATDLRSRTQGRATYSMHFDRYEQAPQNVSEEVVAPPLQA